MVSDPLRLFCLPYAGGSARVFADWAAALPASVEVVPLELPGRGTRFREPPLADLDLVVADVMDRIVGHTGAEFALFGYSYGALLGFEVALRLEQLGIRPHRLFAAAARAPVCPPHEPPASELPDAEFVERLRGMAGTPQALLDNDDLMTLMVPVLRADFTVADRYLHRAGDMLSCPITAFGGTDDTTVPWPSVQRWEQCTVADACVRQIPGNHFFIHSERPSLLSALAHELRSTSCERT